MDAMTPLYIVMRHSVCSDSEGQRPVNDVSSTNPAGQYVVVVPRNDAFLPTVGGIPTPSRNIHIPQRVLRGHILLRGAGGHGLHTLSDD